MHISIKEASAHTHYMSQEPFFPKTLSTGEQGSELDEKEETKPLMGKQLTLLAQWLTINARSVECNSARRNQSVLTELRKNIIMMTVSALVAVLSPNHSLAKAV